MQGEKASRLAVSQSKRSGSNLNPRMSPAGADISARLDIRGAVMAGASPDFMDLFGAGSAGAPLAHILPLSDQDSLRLSEWIDDVFKVHEILSWDLLKWISPLEGRVFVLGGRPLSVFFDPVYSTDEGGERRLESLSVELRGAKEKAEPKPLRETLEGGAADVEYESMENSEFLSEFRGYALESLSKVEEIMRAFFAGSYDAALLEDAMRILRKIRAACREYGGESSPVCADIEERGDMLRNELLLAVRFLADYR